MTVSSRIRAAREPKRDLRLYLALAACCFGLYSLFLTVVPTWAIQHGSESGQAGVLVAIIAASALIGDALVGRISARLGRRSAILLGIGIAALACAILIVATVFAVFVAAAVCVGLAIAMLMSPTLSGLSTRAGKSQVAAQSVNAAWQRFGALVTAVFLMNVLSDSSRVLVVIAMTLLVAALLVMALLLAPERGRAPGVEGRHSGRRFDTLRLVRSSALLRGGLVVNATTGMLVMVGASFFPLVLVALHKPNLLMAGLVAREILSVVAALAFCRWASRIGLSRFWVATATIGAAGLIAFPFVPNEPILVLLFALHGAAVGTGIVLGNVLVYDGTTDLTRTHGFAASAMAGRLVTIVIPLVLGAVLAVSSGLAMLTAAAIVGVAVLVYLLLTRSAYSDAPV